ncbi:MAG: T9SS type A sorting domain-containing protein [Bacteroidales bacterium]|nr:T9SS type A sorting domain-containing protein [Bacteroidales bacterium]
MHLFSRHILKFWLIWILGLWGFKTLQAQPTTRFTDALHFSSITLNGEASPMIEAGDTLVFSVHVNNAGNEPFQNCQLTVTSVNPHVHFLDSTEYFEYIAPGNEYALHSCATCVLDEEIADGDIVTFTFLITNNTETAIAYRSYRVQSFRLSLTDYFVIDNGNRNGLVNSNETDTIFFTFHNEGTSEISNITFTMQTDEPGIQVVSTPMLKEMLYGDETFVFPAIISTNSQFIDGHTFDVEITAARQSSGTILNRQFVSIIGISNCTDFAAGVIPPEMYGEGTQASWFLDNANAYSDFYSLRSGVITHYDSSTVNMPVTIHHDGEISFMYRVSSENNYDWLYFYIDGVQKARWSGQGDWTSVSYPILEGNHILTWRYIKDQSVNSGSDCVWIDDICLSNYDEELPQLAISPTSIDVIHEAEESPCFERTLQFSNESGVYLLFDNELCDENNNPVGWVSVATPNGSLNAHQQRNITLNFNTSGFFAGDYTTALRVTVAGLDTTFIIPITLHKAAKIDDHTMSAQDLHLYPNPATQYVTLEMSEGEEMNGSAVITDLLGRVCHQQKAEGTQCRIPVADLPTGMYFLTYQDGGKTVTKKFLKD